MTFLTFNEIVDDIVSHLTDNERAILRETYRSELPIFHHSTGRHIRNYYDLWKDGNPLTTLNYVPEIRNGVDWSERHPDAVSTKIIEAVWERVTNSNR